MRRSRLSVLSVTGLAVVLAAAGCGGSSEVTGADALPAAGHGVIAGTLVDGAVAASSITGFSARSGQGGIVVTVEGTSLQSIVDEEGEFALSGVPAGTVTLHFQGPGVDALLTVSGLVGGQVLTLKVHVSGHTAQTASTPTCSPTSEVKFTGVLEGLSGTELLVGGRAVDAGEIRKVWRGDRRIALEDLAVGEKVKVWGTLRGDGVVLAEEISALGDGPDTGGGERVSFRGRVEQIGFVDPDVHGNPNGGSHRLLFIKGRKVKTDGGTRFKWSDGTALDPAQIQVGDMASVEGWLKPEGYVLATRLVIDCR